MSRPLYLIAAAGAAFLSAASPTLATTIEIDTLLNNASFEGSGGWTYNGSPSPGGAVYAPTSNQYTAGADGLASGIVPNGSNVAYIPTSVSGSGEIIQITSATYSANTDYTFSFWVGTPKTLANTSTSISTTPINPSVLYGYWLRDGVANSNLGSGTNSNAWTGTFTITAPAVGQWQLETVTLSQQSIAAAVAVGHTIGIEFYDGGSQNDQEVNFDIGPATSGGNGGAATPLPAALPLFATGLGAMGLLGWRRKRKAA